MARKRLALLLGLILAAGLSSSAPILAQQSTTGPVPPPGTDRGLRAPARSQVLIPNVPAYYWHHGCGPTALGMVIGYYDGIGFDDLVPGSAATQTPAVDAMMADDRGQPDCDLPDGDHYQDYACPIDWSAPVLPDRSQTGGAHTSNCVADFMRTSWSSRGNLYGWSYDTDVPAAFRRYVRMVSAYEPVSMNMWSTYFTWNDYRAEIDAGRPVVLLVDIDGDGNTDHFVAAIGYDDVTGEYACHDTWDMGVHWYHWAVAAQGVPWGVFSITTCSLTYPVAACCVGGGCEVLTEAECLARSGLWLGTSTPGCETNPCSQNVVDAGGVLSTLPRITATPNPLNGSTLIRLSSVSRNAGTARLAVYDLAGRQVRRLADLERMPADFEISWDGRDDAGNPVVSGVYVLRLNETGGSIRHRITIVR